MKPKTLIALVLTVFVVGSLAYLLFTGAEPADTKLHPGYPSVGDSAKADVVMIYFDGGKDCSTCDKLEGYAYETLRQEFNESLEAGTLAWQRLNMDAPENEHYVTEFGLYTKSIVLIRLENGDRLRHENLEKIWDLVYDKVEYQAYIRERLQDFLGSQP
jgi:hypothetical protein